MDLSQSFLIISIDIDTPKGISLYNKVHYKCTMVSKSVFQKPVSMEMEGYEMIEKVAKPSGTTARVLVPRHWIGKKVRVVRVEL